VAVLATALNLRLAVASVPPLIDEIRDAVPLSGTAAGVLTTLPVVCMAVGATVVPRLVRRMGHELPLVLVGFTMAAGILIRLAPHVVALYLGTIVAGIGIALGNVLVPSLVKRDFHERAGFMTGIYTMAISTSAGIAAGLTVPIEDALGKGWREALAIWALPAFVCAVIWVPFARHPSAVADRRTQTPHRSSRLMRDRLAWQVALFMGVQSLMFGKVTFDAGSIAEFGTLGGGTMSASAAATSNPIQVHLDATTLGARPGDNFFAAGGSVEFFNCNSATVTLGSGADTVYAQPNETATINIAGGNPAVVWKELVDREVLKPDLLPERT